MARPTGLGSQQPDDTVITQQRPSIDESVDKVTVVISRELIVPYDVVASWDTVGVSENLIDASWEALVVSIDYGLAHGPSGRQPAE